MLNRVVSILTTVLSVGLTTVPALMSKVNRPMGALVGTIINAILQAEAKFGSGTGDAKRQAVQEAINVAAPTLVESIELATGKELADESLFASGIAKVQEGLVDILNAFQVLPKVEAKKVA